MILKIWLSSGVIFAFAFCLAATAEGAHGTGKLAGFCFLLFLVVTALCAIAGIWGIS